MASKEGITQKGVGVEYKKSVSVRKDRVSGHGDMTMSGTQSAYSKSQNDSKKA